MTETAKSTQTNRTRNLVSAGIIGALVGILIWWIWIGPRPRDEGDRPPIIIGDGSINLMLAGDPTKIGIWAGAGATWVHDYSSVSTTAKVQHFDFRVYNGKNNASERGCSDPTITPPLSTRALQIMSANMTMTLSIDAAGNAKAEFDGPAGLHKDTKFWLRGKGAPMQSVTFTRLTGGQPVTCEFEMGGGQNSEPSVLHILQRKP